MAVYPTKAPTPIAPPAAKPVAEVTPEVTAAAPRKFETVVEDAPAPPEVHARKLNPKTLAEHAAGREAISQYTVPAE